MPDVDCFALYLINFVQISRGSIVVEFKVSDVDSMNSEQVDQTVDEMKKQVSQVEIFTSFTRSKFGSSADLDCSRFSSNLF